jgi:hypothetical protein
MTPSQRCTIHNERGSGTVATPSGTTAGCAILGCTPTDLCSGPVLIRITETPSSYAPFGHLPRKICQENGWLVVLLRTDRRLFLFLFLGVFFVLFLEDVAFVDVVFLGHDRLFFKHVSVENVIRQAGEPADSALF